MSSQSGICDQILATLRRIIRSNDIHSRRLSGRYGLTSPQLVVLLELAKRDDIPVGELARRISLSNATVTNILGRLEKRGFVIRARSESDRRRVLIQLSGAGRDVLREAPPLIEERFRGAIEDMREWERTQILATLQRVAEMMEAKPEGDGAAGRRKRPDSAGR